MRTQTQVSLSIETLKASENLNPDPQGYIFKIFMASSQVNSKVFKIHSQNNNLFQSFKIKNISAKQLEFWLCNTNNKIIATASLSLGQKLPAGAFYLDLKMLNTQFGKINGHLQIDSYQIQKQIYIEPDQQLLKKVQDPLQKKRKEEEQAKKQKQTSQALQMAKNEKKHAITVTRFNKKDEPFV